MLKKIFKMLIGKKSLNEDTRKMKDSSNYWADKDEVDYSPAFTAQDVLSSTETIKSSDTAVSKKRKKKKDKKDTFGSGYGGCGCGGGCIGGCGGGCF